MHARPLDRPLAALLLLGVLLVTFSMAGCSSKSSGGSPTPQADTTVLVYVIGSDLETRSQFATQNILEMMEVGSTASMNVVLQTGGATPEGTVPADKESMQPESINWTQVQRYLVHQGSLQQLADLGPDQRGTKLDMGSPATLGDFLRWGLDRYPAEKYIVVLWDHGGGVNHGVGPDEVTRTPLPVAGISKTLAAVSTAMKQKFTIAGFDTCLMGTAEVATSLASSAEYLVASEDLEPGPGWDYKAFLEYVAQNPTATGDAIGRKIVDTYVAKSTRHDTTYPVTLSVVDLSRSQSLIDATGAFATALDPYAGNVAGWKQIALARLGALDWDTSAIFGMATDLVDMHGFVTRVVEHVQRNIAPDPDLASKGAALKAAIGTAVVYSRGSGTDVGATGLTVYFPSVLGAFVKEDGPEATTYTTNTAVDGQPFFAATYTGVRTATGLDPAGLVRKYFDFYAANKADLEASVTMGEYPGEIFAATISSDFDYALASHRPTEPCKLYTGAKVTAPYVLAPCYDGMQAVIDRTPATGAGAWKIDFAPREMWPHIWDFPVALVPDQIALNRTGEFATYLVPVFLYDESDAEYVPGFLRVVDTFDPDPDKRYEVLGFQYHAVRTSGKVAPVVRGQFYALGAYHWESGEFLRTDRAVFVEGRTLQITEKLIGGGLFTYFVADLTGTIQSPKDLVHYPAAIIRFGANPPTIAPGGTTTLFWDVAGATSISIDQDVGPQTGTYVLVKPEATTTYTLTATNSGGSVTGTVKVTVTPAPP